MLQWMHTLAHNLWEAIVTIYLKLQTHKYFDPANLQLSLYFKDKLKTRKMPYGIQPAINEE